QNGETETIGPSSRKHYQFDAPAGDRPADRLRAFVVAMDIATNLASQAGDGLRFSASLCESVASVPSVPVASVPSVSRCLRTLRSRCLRTPPLPPSARRRIPLAGAKLDTAPQRATKRVERCGDVRTGLAVGRPALVVVVNIDGLRAEQVDAI